MLAVLAILSMAKLIAISQRSKLELVYDQSSPFFKDFVSNTQISTLIYEPFMLALSPAFQAIIYLMKEVPYENLYPDPFNREVLTLADGATIGLDWDGDIPKAGQVLQQPLVVIAPGLNGGTHNIYTIELLKKARR